MQLLAFQEATYYIILNNLLILFFVVNNLFFIFISISILLTCGKASEVLIIGQLLSNYPNLLLEIPSYSCPVEFFYFVFLVFTRDLTEIQSCLLRPASRGNYIKCLFQGHNRIAQIGFKLQLC